MANWLDKYAMGGALPGATGMMYARTQDPAPSNGKYAKKTLASAKNGSVIKDDRGQLAYPGEITEIGSNDITMQGVDYPVLGVSDTGDTQMMYPDQDYKFDGEKVVEYPMAQDGGWLDKYQDGGTLMRDKKVGEKISEVAKYDLRLIKPNFKNTTKELYDPNCPDGIGCSKQATDIAQSITGLPRVAYAPSDAAYRDAVAERTGLINVFNQEGEQKTNANSNTSGWKYPTEQDFTTWRVGDIVTLDAGKDRYFGYKSPKGYTSSDNSGVTHNGVITGFTETGRPIITHGGSSGKYKGKQYSEVLGDDNRVRNLGHGRYAIKSVWRPKEVDLSGKVSSIENVIDIGEERAGRKQATTSNQSFYLKPTEEEKLQKDYPVGYEFSGASNRLNTKNKLVNLFNDEKLDKDLQYKLGITAQELDKLKPVVYGVFGQESNFNDVDSGGASFKELIGNLFGNNSRGGAQIKMSSLTVDEKKVLGIKKASDLDKDEVAYKASLLMLNNSRKRMNQEVKQGTHPELADKDEYFRAGYYYNSPARAIQSSDKFTKRKNKNATFSDVKKNELRMDEGSYPYKLMERAKDLGVNMDFDTITELEPVVVRSMVKNNKGTTFVPKQETGGWLDKYQDGGNINKKLKEEAEERLSRMNRPKSTISQYTPKPGEQAKFDKQKLQRIAEDNAPLNRMAASKGAENMQDAIEAAMIMEGGLAAGKLVGKGAKAAVKQTGRIYNTVATGESALPIAWKSPAKGLSQEASDSMFKGIANTNKLSDADRALLLEYQYDSKPFTGRWGKIDQSKRQALNDIIKNNELNINNNAILTRKFSPNNQSLGAEFINGRLNLGDRPSSFSAGIGVPSYGSGAVDRLVVPNRYTKQMGNNLLANEYGIPSDKTFDLISGGVKDFAAARGVMADDLINAEREVIGTGLDFKRIGKVKNDIGGYDHIVRPKDATFAKYLTEETALKNAYKLNPLAFKTNSEAYYRMLGKEGYEDVLESGVIRANPGKGGLKSQEFNDVYFSMKHPWDGRNYGYVTKSGEPIGGVGYKGPYMAELTGQELNYPISSFPTANMAQSKVPISIENSGIKLYKQDWLKGYKEVPKKEEGGWLNKYK